jgi:hypothetical protein
MNCAFDNVPPVSTLIDAPLWNPVPFNVRVVAVFTVTDDGEIDVMFGIGFTVSEVVVVPPSGFSNVTVYEPPVVPAASVNVNEVPVFAVIAVTVPPVAAMFTAIPLTKFVPVRVMDFVVPTSTPAGLTPVTVGTTMLLLNVGSADGSMSVVAT